MFKKFKKFALGVAAAVGLSAPAFAEGEATIDLQAATTQVTAMKTALVSWISTNAPTLVAILAAALVITLIFVGYGWITRGAKKAK